MLSVQDRADLLEATRLGLIAESFLEELLQEERQASCETDTMLQMAAKERKRNLTMGALELGLALAQNDLKIARKSQNASSIRGAEAKVGEWEQKVLARRRHAVIPDAPAPMGESSNIGLPAEVVDAVRLIRELRAIEEELSRIAVSSEVRPNTPIQLVDAGVCAAWGCAGLSLSSDPPDAMQVLRAMSPYEAGRLLSARNAEKAAIRYYELLGLEVDDVAVTQLDPGSADWRNFDLRAGDVCIDVKNARESLHGNGRYVEHCVPEFKMNRLRAADVRIVGTVSPYIKQIDRYFDSYCKVRMLGEVAPVDIDALTNWAQARFGGHLDIRDLTRAGFLPGWLFEFPPKHYPGRQSSLEAAHRMLSKLFDSLAYSGEVPPWLWVFSDDPIPEGLDTSAVLAELRDLHTSIGISRRSLYVLALGLACEEVVDGAGTGATLRQLLDVCRMSTRRIGADQSIVTPLGLDDPLDYVCSLISMLAEIVSTLRHRQIEVAGFRLVHPEILECVLSGGRRRTLFAYCGGWQSDPFPARCGNTPLTIARHRSCSRCEHLICDNCGHCSNSCPECMPRQAATARKAPSIEMPADGEW